MGKLCRRRIDIEVRFVTFLYFDLQAIIKSVLRAVTKRDFTENKPVAQCNIVRNVWHQSTRPPGAPTAAEDRGPRSMVQQRYDYSADQGFEPMPDWTQAKNPNPLSYALPQNADMDGVRWYES